MNRLSKLAFALTLTVFGSPASALAEVRLTWLPGFSARGVSADGRVVVGNVDGRASRWTAEEGTLDLGTVPGTDYGLATSASSDGEVIVGRSFGDGPRGFRWTRSTGIQALPSVDGLEMGTANGVSGDGSVVVGISGFDYAGEATAWSLDGAQRLGALSTTLPYSQANGVSLDGSTVVGTTEWGSGPEAFHWTAQTGMIALGNLAGSRHDSYGTAASADGNIVVGRSVTAAGNGAFGGRGTEAFRWTADGGMVGLGDLPGGGFSSSALALSADGTVIVGTSEVDVVPSGPFGDFSHVYGAFIWTESGGMRSLQELLEADYGLDLMGLDLTEATGISADGNVIVGNSTGTERGAWVLQLAVPEPSTFVLCGIGTLLLFACRYHTARR